MLCSFDQLLFAIVSALMTLLRLEWSLGNMIAGEEGRKILIAIDNDGIESIAVIWHH